MAEAGSGAAGDFAAGFAIRPATEADRPALERFMAGLQDFERALEPNRRPGPAMAAAHVTALLGWVAEHPAAGCLIAEDADGPAGFLLWGIETEIGDYVLPENRVVGWLSDLWIEPRARRHGLAGRLVRAAEAHLAAHGIARVEVSALPANAAAIAAYEALGYRPAALTLARAIDPDRAPPCPPPAETP